MEFDTNTTFDQIKRKSQKAVDEGGNYVDEADWMAFDKLDKNEVLKIAIQEDLMQKSPTSYDSAENRSIIKIIRSKIADKLKREVDPQ